MCIVAIAWQLFDELPLVLLSNRDEFLQRPTESLHQWSDQPIFMQGVTVKVAVHGWVFISSVTERKGRNIINKMDAGRRY